jgi:chorismate mutase / prephenate dehydratase
MKKKSLEKIRKALREKDLEIIALLNDRAKLALEVGKIKSENGQDVYDPARERLVYQYLTQINQGPFSDKAVKDIFREIISASRDLQRPITVAYFGPEASFTHLAALAHFGQRARFSAQKNIAMVFEQVERERTAYGVVPIENSGEGSVKPTLDRLIATPLSIRTEIYLRISHYLLAGQEDLDRIKRVYSHPQAIAQCQGWLDKNLPQGKFIKVENTAQAAQKVLKDKEGAAIGSQQAAQLYGLKILADRIEDYPLNTTRFLVLGKGYSESTGRDKTSILFGTPHKPGALFQALKPFTEKGLNLLKIESYPVPDRMWEYLFFVDFSGHREDGKVRQCLEELEQSTTFLKVLGSYPSGEVI